MVLKKKKLKIGKNSSPKLNHLPHIHQSSQPPHIANPSQQVNYFFYLPTYQIVETTSLRSIQSQHY